MADPAEVFNVALGLDVRDRAALAQRLLASLDELSEEEAVGGISRRSREGSSSRRGSRKSGKTVPVTPIEYHEAAGIQFPS